MDMIDRLLEGHEPARPGPGAARRVAKPHVLGLRMAALYRHWQETGGPDLVRVAETLLAHVGVSADAPVAKTCISTAEAVTEWQGSEYHSARHHAEVATNATVLAAISARLEHPLAAHDCGILLAAALAHDIYWEPLTNQHSRFAAETKSAAALDAIAAGGGVGPEDRRAMHVLVMATEPYARAELAALQSSPAAALSPQAAATFAPLLADEPLLQLALLLSDADLLGSAGLSRAWSSVQWQRLARERDLPSEAADWSQFFDGIVGPDFLSYGGRYFSSNLASIRRAMESGG